MSVECGGDVQFARMTSHHANYFAWELTRRRAASEEDRLAQSLFDASVDLNPHQTDAALFALNNPLRMLCITPCGLWQHGLGRSTALFFLPIGQAIGCKKRLVAHPDPRYHSLARVMQSILKQWHGAGRRSGSGKTIEAALVRGVTCR
jgi:hypothetical protein